MKRTVRSTVDLLTEQFTITERPSSDKDERSETVRHERHGHQNWCRDAIGDDQLGNWPQRAGMRRPVDVSSGGPLRDTNLPAVLLPRDVGVLTRDRSGRTTRG